MHASRKHGGRLGQGHAASVARGAVSAGLALAMALSGAVPALAETSSGQTNLYVEVKESSLTTPEGYGEQMRVTIPVAINYVADETGALTGPADGATMIVNGTKTGAVHVAQIGVTPAQGITLVTTADAADADDEAYLSVTPGTGTADTFGNYVTPAAPTSGEWDIAQGESLALNNLGGKLGGIGGAIDPANKTQVATVNWTVAAGTAAQAAARANRFTIHQVTPDAGTIDLVTTRTGSTDSLAAGYTWHVGSKSGETVSSVALAIAAANEGATEIYLYGVPNA